MRNYGIMSDRRSPRGQSTPPVTTRDEILPRDSNIYEFPSGSILADHSAAIGAPFERSRLSQALLDVLALGSLSLLICSLASAIGIFGYVLFFT